MAHDRTQIERYPIGLLGEDAPAEALLSLEHDHLMREPIICNQMQRYTLSGPRA